MTTVHAYAVKEPSGRFEPYEYTVGPLGPSDVEINVLHCGVCHSDLSMRNNDWGITSYPLVAGHEVVGRIAAVGSGVKALSEGDFVGLGWHSGYCDTCDCCRAGDHNLCAGAIGTIVGHHGGFADKVRAEATSVVRLPEGIDLQSAGPLLCGGITVFNPLVEYGIRPTDKVAVIGIGGLGHLAVKFCSAWGCEVTAFTSSGPKLQDALKLGAHHALDSRDPAAVQSVAGRFDLILSTVNVALDWNTYLGALKPKGRLHFLGATLVPLDISVFQLLAGQRSISASPVGSPGTIRKMLDFAVRHAIQPQVEVFPMSHINDAFAHLESGQARYRIVLSN
ncbi:MAG: NADPH-dependent aldehyde reductase Ahr [Kiritimatiellia bacterium]